MGLGRLDRNNHGSDPVSAGWGQRQCTLTSCILLQSKIFSTRRQGESMKARILWAVMAMMGILAGCASGSKTFLYATGPGTNEVFQFQIHSNGSLTALSQPTASVGSAPASVVLQPAGNFAYIANFAGNNVTLLSVNKGNGQLTVPTNTNPIPQLNPPNFFNTGTGPI